MIFLLGFITFGIKLINDYLYYINEINYENKLVGLEIENLKENGEYKKIDTLLYAPDNDKKYNNLEYIGSKTNLSKIYLFDKEDIIFYNRIINIVKSYKYSDNILKTLDSLNNRLLLNEINIKNVFIYRDKYSNNKNDIILYYSKNNIKLFSIFGFIYFTEYFFCTHFWC